MADGFWIFLGEAGRTVARIHWTVSWIHWMVVGVHDTVAWIHWTVAGIRFHWTCSVTEVTVGRGGTGASIWRCWQSRCVTVAIMQAWLLRCWLWWQTAGYGVQLAQFLDLVLTESFVCKPASYLVGGQVEVFCKSLYFFSPGIWIDAEYVR